MVPQEELGPTAPVASRRNWRSRWSDLSLSAKFGIAGSIVLIAGMAAIGSWVADRIRNGVVQNTAAATALYMDSALSPILQELAASESLSPAAQKKIDALLENSQIGRRVFSIKIWKEGGRIVYSTRHHLIGKTFTPSDDLKRAWLGEVSAEFDDLHDAEDAGERASGLPLLEMYAPVRESSSNRIIAVAEFYSIAHELAANLRNSVWQSWLLVGLITTTMMGALFGIVQGGSRTIQRQQSSLRKQIDQLRELLAQNLELRTRIEKAYRRTGDLNEKFLRRLGADLHDGPAQLMGYALLRLGSIDAAKATDKDQLNQDIAQVRAVLDECLAETRAISAGLAVPELEGATIYQAMRHAIELQSRRLGVEVASDIEDAHAFDNDAIAVCAFRFVQEGLNNAFRHADGAGVRVAAKRHGETLILSISDDGPGIRDAPEITGKGQRIGIAALRDRVESLGGEFQIVKNIGRGTTIRAIFDKHALELKDDW